MGALAGVIVGAAIIVVTLLGWGWFYRNRRNPENALLASALTLAVVFVPLLVFVFVITSSAHV